MTDRTKKPDATFPAGIFLYPSAPWYGTWNVDLVAPPMAATLMYDLYDREHAVRGARAWGDALNMPVYEGKRDNRYILPYTWKEAAE